MALEYEEDIEREDEPHGNILHGTGHIFRKTYFRVIVVLIILLVIAVATFVTTRYRTYQDYTIRQTMGENGDEADVAYIPFGNYVLRYGASGIACLKGEDVVWDEAYSVKNPEACVCGSYAAVCDKGGNDIYIYDKNGNCGFVTTAYPIREVEVAGQGVVAAMLEDTSAEYIEVYDKDGNCLVSHKAVLEDNGYPIDFSLSGDGAKMVVSYVEIANATVSEKIVFYNFSKAGQNSTDRSVGTFDQYGETVVPAVEFISDNEVVAVGSGVVSFYKMKSKPSLQKEITLEDEIEKVFFDEGYLGLIFDNTNGTSPYRIEVYNADGSRKMRQDLDGEFETAKFSGKNVLLYDDMSCRLVSFGGVKRFEHTFDGVVEDIVPLGNEKTYLITAAGKTEKIKLK